MAVKDRRLTVDDLSAQEGVFYAGTCPGGKLETLWEFSHESESKKDGVRYWFSDAYQPASRMPLLVPFKGSEVGRYLRRV
jgi:hypothetical protein